tara:strand:- start:3583 stop:4182 length:600 start_codon:yes stop_codon:yes gene_type:complete
MKSKSESFANSAKQYLDRLNGCFNEDILESIELLARDLKKTWDENKQVFLCGNGGSAANAMHITNDFHYGIGAFGSAPIQPGLRVEALPANSAVLSCLANDTGYENIFSQQLEVKANKNDLLIVLSGSGNSLNIVNALKIAKKLSIKSYAILAFDGGLSLDIADKAIHFPINDMQVAEDIQLIVGHICMQWLNKNRPLI